MAYPGTLSGSHENRGLVQMLRLMETFGYLEARRGIQDLSRLEAIGLVAVKQLFLCRIESRSICFIIFDASFSGLDTIYPEPVSCLAEWPWIPH